jgi:carbon monoxide dehydrogenase subunit G
MLIEGGTMTTEQSVSASVLIDVPIEKAWELASDTGRYAEWVEATLEVLRTDGPARLDSTYDERTRILGPWKSTTRWRVSEFDPPQRQVHEGQGVFTAKDMAVVIELSPEDEQTRFTLTIRYTPRFGLVGTLIDRGVQATLERAQQRSVQAFASLMAGR